MTARAASAAPAESGDLSATDTTNALDWLGVAVLTATGALSALMETLLVPFYVGTVVVPIAVVMALVGNVALPLLVRSIVPRTFAAAAPFVAWLIVVVGFGVFARPEGDVILPGNGPGGVVFVSYGVLLGGTLAGAVTLVVVSGSQPRRRG